MPNLLAGLDWRRLAHSVFDDLGRSYTSEEVAARLRPGGTCGCESERTRAILACAARPSEWLHRVDGGTCWRLGRLLVGRLPKIIYLYRSGLSLEEIGECISFFGGPGSASRAFDAATRAIAARLNDRDRPIPW